MQLDSNQGLGPLEIIRIAGKAKESVVDDFAMKQDILDALTFDPQIDTSHIGVVVDKGVVTLTGHVQSYAEKLAVEQAARRVKGVLAIAEEIEVRVPNHMRTADDEIAKRVIDILRWNATVPLDAVRVSVHDGWVTLEGELNWQFQRLAAQQQLAQLSGLVGVVNNITIRNGANPASIREHIEAALQRNAIADPKSVLVIVLDDGQVNLEGVVHGRAERDVIERIAWAAPGVRSVESHLRVVA